MNYIIKVLFKYPSGRLPSILARLAIKRKCFWFSEWSKLADEINVSIRNDSINEEYWTGKKFQILEGLRNLQIMQDTERAQNSSHGIYGHLKHDIGFKYFTDGISRSKISWIFKARGGLIYLNSSNQREEARRECTLCNLRAEENIVHFLGFCPILKEIRLKHFKKNTLQFTEICSILNNEVMNGWERLFAYAKEAWFYRRMLVEEYNT